KTFARESFDHITKFPFLAADNRGQQHDAAAGRQGENPVDDVAGSLFDDWDTSFRAKWLADMSIEQTQVVINFGSGGNNGARAGTRTALLDRNSGRESLDEIDVRLLHLIEELPGVGGERLDIFALAFSIDGVKRERGFPGTA